MNLILNELLGGPGCNLNVEPADRYIHPGEAISFMEIAMRVQADDLGGHDILVGYQQIPALQPGDTVVNPRDKHVKKTWEEMSLILLRGSPSASRFKS